MFSLLIIDLHYVSVLRSNQLLWKLASVITTGITISNSQSTFSLNSSSRHFLFWTVLHTHTHVFRHNLSDIASLQNQTTNIYTYLTAKIIDWTDSPYKNWSVLLGNLHLSTCKQVLICRFICITKEHTFVIQQETVNWLLALFDLIYPIAAAACKCLQFVTWASLFILWSQAALNVRFIIIFLKETSYTSGNQISSTSKFLNLFYLPIFS